MAFNALKHVQELREAGVPQEQAEVQAKGLQLVQNDLLENLATKEDLKHNIELLRKDMKESENNLKRDIKELEIKLSGNIKELETKLSGDIKELEIRLGGDIKDSQNSMMWKLTGIFAALLAIFRFLPESFKAAS